ncbi:alpha/beta fold hydrolase [Paraburkholderia sediminicola]|uniref:alpha/beta fold hydrolase n=1 Tax=Paraburkholderia sediminicola TaxID=458836 RepID=UPI0038B77A6D
MRTAKSNSSKAMRLFVGQSSCNNQYQREIAVMRTFVLVHGSWTGGWCWEQLRPYLEAQGHRVLAPSLTGVADRHHLATEETGLRTHIDDVSNLIEWERAENVILVGHSYGGMVITGVAAKVPQRLAHLVYLDAFLPRKGESAWDLLPWLRDAFQSLRLSDRPWLVRPVATGTLPPEIASVVEDRLTPMPIRTHEEPLPTAPSVDLAATYLHCVAEPSHFNEVAARASASGMEVKTLDAGHMALLTHPMDIAAILLHTAMA